MPAEAFVITLFDPNKNVIQAVYLYERGGRVVAPQIPADQGLSGRVIATGESVYLADIHVGMEGLKPVHFGDYATVRSILAVPMRLGGTVIGMLSAQSYQPDAYAPNHQHLLEMLASYAGIALENTRLFGEVQQLAITDALTGLYNRRQLDELGLREFSRARRFERPLAALMIDIDHFKAVNDSFGHAAGDQVLSSIAQRLQAIVREVDILGRYGGEEFVALLPETDREAACAVAGRMRTEVEKMRPVIGDTKIRVTVSIGIAMLTPAVADLKGLVANADAALYLAKRGGRNRISVR
jgi:diguanylate cyclase (GGDEF)-like protein